MTNNGLLGEVDWVNFVWHVLVLYSSLSLPVSAVGGSIEIERQLVLRVLIVVLRCGPANVFLLAIMPLLAVMLLRRHLLSWVHRFVNAVDPLPILTAVADARFHTLLTLSVFPTIRLLPVRDDIVSLAVILFAVTSCRGIAALAVVSAVALEEVALTRERLGLVGQHVVGRNVLGWQLSAVVVADARGFVS